MEVFSNNNVCPYVFSKGVKFGPIRWQKYKINYKWVLFMPNNVVFGDKVFGWFLYLGQIILGQCGYSDFDKAQK